MRKLGLILLVATITLSIIMGQLPIFYVSADSTETWTKVFELNKAGRAAVWTGDKFFVSGNSGVIYSSTDGTNWTQHTSGIYTILYDIAWNGEVLVAVGNDGSICYSKDGSSWTQVSTGVKKHLEVVIWDGSKFIAAGQGGVMFTSTNGEKWRNISPESDVWVQDIAFNGDMYVAVGFLGGAMISTNGMEWTKVDVKLEGWHNFISVAWHKDKFVAVGGDFGDGAIYTSTDGKKWTKVENLVLKDRVESIVSNGETLTAVGCMGQILSSKDGLSWSFEDSGSKEWLSSVKCNDSMYIAVGLFNIYTKPNKEGNTSKLPEKKDINNDAGKLTNNPITLPAKQSYYSITENDSLGEIILVDDKYFIVGGKGLILVSEDCNNWYKLETDVSNYLNDVVWNGTRFVAVGSNGTILSSDDGATWTKRSVSTSKHFISVEWDGKCFIAVCQNDIYTSDDGIYWYHDTGNLNALERNTHIYLNVIYNKDTKQHLITGTEGLGKVVLLYSNNDMKKWEYGAIGFVDSTQPSIYGAPYDVVWNGSIYVAVGNHGKIHTSSEGTVFTITKHLTDKTLRGVDWSGELFVAVGHDGIIVKSHDGYEWTEVASPTTANLTDVVWDGYRFVAVGDKGLILNIDRTGTNVTTVFEDRPKKKEALTNLSEVSSWALDAVNAIWTNELSDIALFSDYQKPITREEFAMIAVRLYEKIHGTIAIASDFQPFNDIANSKYSLEIRKANKLGIVGGIGEGRFNPEGNIKRQEISKMLYNTVAAIYPKDNLEVKDDIVFADNDQIDGWARVPVLYLFKNGIMTGTGNNGISPLSNSTREQAFVFIYRLAKLKSILK